MFYYKHPQNRIENFITRSPSSERCALLSERLEKTSWRQAVNKGKTFDVWLAEKADRMRQEREEREL